MSGVGRRVLIAGAGWRVARFVVPALQCEGVRPEQMIILRQTPGAPRAPALQPLRTIGHLAELGSSDVEFTINCVAAPALVAVQRALVARFPRAVHFCDTPVATHDDRTWQVLQLWRARLYSLEDWPLMPNLRCFVDEVGRQSSGVDLCLDRFGILTHFLSIYRGLRGSQLLRRALHKDQQDVIGEPRAGVRIRFAAPKDLPTAKISLRSERTVLEDFHEVESRPHKNAEILYRVFDDTGISYFRGPHLLSAHRVPQAILDGFFPLTVRKNVHEADKMVALTRLFRAAFAGRPSVAYPYLSAVKDAFIARRLDVRDVATFF